jgi:EmrB/QacA subfamily drug resistance transporter
MTSEVMGAMTSEGIDRVGRAGAGSAAPAHRRRRPKERIMAELLENDCGTVPTTTKQVGWAPLVVVLVGTFITFLDFFVVNVALPSVRTELHADPAEISLVVAGYGVTFAAGMITGGRLGDLHGRRRMFVLGLLLFTLTSLACGLAPTAGLLVTARFLQGAAGALLTPQVLAVLGTTYVGHRRGTAFAAYGFAMGIAAVLGQLAGGALIRADVAGLGWRVIFLVNVPIGLVALPFARRVIPESRGDRAGLDLLGTVLGTAAVVALVLPLVESREHGWPPVSVLSLAAVPVLGGVFAARQRRRVAAGRAALVDPALFRSARFAVGCLVALVFALVPAAFFFVLALYLQDGRGDDALRSGVVFVAVGVGYFAALTVATSWSRRLGARVLALGAVLVAAGCVLLIDQVRAASEWWLAPGLAVIGLGIGLVLVPLSATVLTGTDPRLAGSAAGVLATAQQVGGALGLAVIGSVFFASGPVVDATVVCLVVLAGTALLTAALAGLLRAPAAAKPSPRPHRPAH